MDSALPLVEEIPDAATTGLFPLPLSSVGYLTLTISTHFYLILAAVLNAIEMKQTIEIVFQPYRFSL